MRRNYITFRSVTPAQRGQRLLQHSGIHCSLLRTPRYMQDRGCGYCLRLAPEDTHRALELLRTVAYSKVYTSENGLVEEWQP